jgi:MFS family permease
MSRSPSFLTRIFRAFRYRDFRLMWIGACVSTIGTFVQQFAQSWLVYDLTKDAFYLGLDLFLGQLPIMLFSLFGGVFADRMDRRKMLLASQYIQMACAFLLALLFVTHVIHVWHILALSFFVGVGQSFGGPAYSALLPTLVDPEDLSNAIAMNSIQFNLARVIGPVLAGVAFAHFGAAACFGLNGLSFLAVIAALLVLKRGALTAPSSEPVLRSLRTGLKAVRDATPLRGLVGLAFVGSFCALPLVTFLPVFAHDVFHRDAKGYSVLLAAFGAGAIAGAIGVAGFGRVAHRGALAISMQMSFGALMIGFALSRHPLLSYALLALAGAALMVVFAMFMTLVQSHVEEGLRGRVVSVYSLAFRGAMPLGNLAAGFASKFVRVPLVLVADGAILLAVGAVVLLRSRSGGVTSL